MLQAKTVITPRRTARIQSYLDSAGAITDLVAKSDLVEDKRFLMALTKPLSADAELGGRPSWGYFVNAPYAYADPSASFVGKLVAACDVWRDAPLSPKIAIIRDIVIGTAPGASQDAFRIHDGLYDGAAGVFRRSVTASDKLAIFAAFCQRLNHPGQALLALEPSKLSADFVPLRAIAAVEATFTLH